MHNVILVQGYGSGKELHPLDNSNDRTLVVINQGPASVWVDDAEVTGPPTDVCDLQGRDAFLLGAGQELRIPVQAGEQYYYGTDGAPAFTTRLDVFFG